MTPFGHLLGEMEHTRVSALGFRGRLVDPVARCPFLAPWRRRRILKSLPAPHLFRRLNGGPARRRQVGYLVLEAAHDALATRSNTFAMKLKVALAFPRNLDGVGQTVLGKCILTGQHDYNSEQETKPIHVWSLCSWSLRSEASC